MVKWKKKTKLVLARKTLAVFPMHQMRLHIQRILITILIIRFESAFLKNIILTYANIVLNEREKF